MLHESWVPQWCESRWRGNLGTTSQKLSAELWVGLSTAVLLILQPSPLHPHTCTWPQWNECPLCSITSLSEALSHTGPDHAGDWWMPVPSLLAGKLGRAAQKWVVGESILLVEASFSLESWPAALPLLLKKRERTAGDQKLGMKVASRKKLERLAVGDLEGVISRDVLNLPVKWLVVKVSNTHLYELSALAACTLEVQEPHICLPTGNQPGTALYGDMGRTHNPPASQNTPQLLYICACK